mmetsp:Transcript_30172/g.33719  ORF Transcript_30172/g.33719 Transcript_30172/m.33719 type:complete len:499 (+) Transcript_30172:572-2068(+)|eukprot:CAMPEP_0168523314 /NCGR_PEP_ID=MMETSP0405-20121227/9912_1 /TAXON_ID=498012 /ORGANISM="Trichosphaerium sp, Strain Am-I-7 wt" /LENGTH=498 /DNA_ID=CAMNT_0008545169 /DNA_START=531 /DNA_END=2027 /DNA_ORIENTATION=+
MWQWSDDAGGWRDYDKERNKIIETAFQAKQPSAALTINGNAYNVVFQKKIRQVRVDDSFYYRDVRRLVEQGEKTVVWVDDNPHNNEGLVNEITASGIKVVQLTSTCEAIKYFQRDDLNTENMRVVSDMARDEFSPSSDRKEMITTAGVLLARRLAVELDVDIPYLIFTGDYWQDIIKERWPFIRSCTTTQECRDFITFKDLSLSGLVTNFEMYRDPTRNDKEDYPSYWTPFREHADVVIDNATEEFKCIDRLMNGTLKKNHAYGKLNNTFPSKYKVTRVVRLQDVMQWKLYNVQREKMQRQHKKYRDTPGYKETCKLLRDNPIETSKYSQQDMNKDIREVYLFHGTNISTTMKIKDLGFDNRVGKVSGMFGGGAYFADVSSKSAQYIPCSTCEGGNYFNKKRCTCTCKEDQKDLCMIVSRVLLGDFHLVKKYDEKTYKGTTKHPVRRPPNKEGLNGITYDSVVAERKEWDGCVEWREFVIYDRNQAYAEYLVYYKRVL